MGADLLKFDSKGIYCPQADVYIDPWRPVERALITHAHSDHARYGMKHYLAHRDTVPVMRYRLGQDINVQSIDHGDHVVINGVKISFHPAGHIWGSCQIRLEYQGQIWVVSGDYKTQADPACIPFEPVPCTHFITESTFGLPVYNWQAGEDVFKDINQWCSDNRDEGVVSVLFGYSLGKAQRILTGLDPSIGKIFTHGAVENTNEVLRKNGMPLPETTLITPELSKADFQGGIVVAPPGAGGSNWMRRFGPHRTASASGWMAMRGTRRRRNVDKGFVLSDHADWTGLLEAIEATGAENIFVTHGYTSIFTRYLREQGYNAHVVSTEYEAELAEPVAEAAKAPESSEKDAPPEKGGQP